MKERSLVFIVIVFVVCVCVHAENEGGGLVKKIGALLDSMSVSGVDRHYIDAPEKPWQLIVQGNISQSDLKMSAVLDGKSMFDETWGDINWESRIKTPVASYAGVWAGYRGYGIGYSRNVGGEMGSIFKMGVTGGAYGANLRIHYFHTSEPSVRMAGYMPEWIDNSSDYMLVDPIKVRIMTLDGYYFFNKKRFSYAAAYDQSVLQKRSTGSLMVGAMYHHSTVRYDDGPNADFIMFMNDIGRMKQYQVGVGAGYAYNLVPCKGLLISALVMPVVTFYNRVDVWSYGSKFRDVMSDDRKNPTMEQLDNVDLETLFDIWSVGKRTKHSNPTVVVDTRFSLTYNTGRLFFNVYGQWNRFRYRHGDNQGSAFDWNVNASVGARL